jgi:hypothetical protein
MAIKQKREKRLEEEEELFVLMRVNERNRCRVGIKKRNRPAKIR